MHPHLRRGLRPLSGVPNAGGARMGVLSARTRSSKGSVPEGHEALEA